MGSSHLSAFPFTRRRRRAALQTGFFQFQRARRVGIAAHETPLRGIFYIICFAPTLFLFKY